MAFDFDALIKAGPGLFGAGANYFASNAAKGDEERRAGQIGAAQQPYSSAALDQLLQAQQFNTGANAKSRYDAEMALLSPDHEKQRLAMMRKLQAQGLLGTSTNAPTAGLAEGTAHNPFASSLFAAQEAARQRVAADALDKSQNTLNQMTNRLTALNSNANAAGVNRSNAQPTTNSGGLARMLAGVAGNKDLMSAIFGAFGGKGGAAAAPSLSQQTSANANGQWDMPGSFSVSPQSTWQEPSWAASGDDGYGLFGNDLRYEDYGYGGDSGDAGGWW
jgi:hypothetical protein